MSFSDKTVIITGASAGVGADCARMFAKLGANLVLLARGEQALNKIETELAEITKVLTIPMDVTDSEKCRQMLAKTMEVFGRIDVLVNNAGYHARGDVDNNNAASLAAMVDVNLRAPIELSALVIPFMKKQGSGAIVNVGSLAGRTPLQGAATYSATKAGLRAFSFALADEVRDSNIRVGVVSPGPIDTGFIMSEIDKVEDIVFSQPMSTAEEVAQAILQVASGESNEVVLPRSSGWLTTISYLFPSLRRLLRPALYRKGARLKAEFKARNSQK